MRIMTVSAMTAVARAFMCMPVVFWLTRTRLGEEEQRGAVRQGMLTAR